MRRMERTLVILFSLALLLSAGMPAKAEEYTYMVRIYTGAQGKIDTDNGSFVTIEIPAGEERSIKYKLDETGEYYEIRGLKYGDRVTLDRSRIVVPYDADTGLPVKYNAGGFRLSGRDNSEADTNAANPSFVVTGDMDYVVAYNILDNPVSYTVHYVDTEGNALREPETFYSNIGDKPVVAYRYIDKYQPQAYNIMGTLKEDSENVFTFVYTLIPEAEIITRYTVVVLPGEVIDLGTTVIEGNGRGNGGNGGATEPLAPPENIPDQDIPQDPGNNEEDQGDLNEPEDIIDIDEPDTPLGENEGGKGSGSITIWNGNAFQLSVSIPVLVILIAAIAFGVWKLVKDKKGKKS